MHELSITRNIVAIVEEAAKGRRVRARDAGGRRAVRRGERGDRLLLRRRDRGDGARRRQPRNSQNRGSRALRVLRRRVRDRDAVRDLCLRFRLG